MDFVDGLKGKLPNEELAVIERYVEKRSRETAQAQVTVTPVDTVQHCSLSPQTPKPSSSVCVKLENNEGKMDPERGELESSSAGKGLETPGQQCPPNEGTWNQGRTTVDGFLTAGVGSNPGKIFLHPRNAWAPPKGRGLQTSLSCSWATNPETKRKEAKKTSSLTQVENERRPRFGTRL